MPIVLPIAMVATFLAGMLTIKLIVAPWIVHEFGFVGVIVTFLALLASARWLED